MGCFDANARSTGLEHRPDSGGRVAIALGREMAFAFQLGSDVAQR
jgi:hypothetical protein